MIPSHPYDSLGNPRGNLILDQVEKWIHDSIGRVLLCEVAPIAEALMTDEVPGEYFGDVSLKTPLDSAPLSVRNNSALLVGVAVRKYMIYISGGTEFPALVSPKGFDVPPTFSDALFLAKANEQTLSDPAEKATSLLGIQPESAEYPTLFRFISPVEVCNIDRLKADIRRQREHTTRGRISLTAEPLLAKPETVVAEEVAPTAVSEQLEAAVELGEQAVILPIVADAPVPVQQKPKPPRKRRSKKSAGSEEAKDNMAPAPIEEIDAPPAPAPVEETTSEVAHVGATDERAAVVPVVVDSESPDEETIPERKPLLRRRIKKLPHHPFDYFAQPKLQSFVKDADTWLQNEVAGTLLLRIISPSAENMQLALTGPDNKLEPLSYNPELIPYKFRAHVPLLIGAALRNRLLTLSNSQEFVARGHRRNYVVPREVPPDAVFFVRGAYTDEGDPDLTARLALAIVAPRPSQPRLFSVLLQRRQQLNRTDFYD